MLPGDTKRAAIFQPDAFYHHTDGNIEAGETHWVAMFKVSVRSGAGGILPQFH